jgi:hypothetical protein
MRRLARADRQFPERRSNRRRYEDERRMGVLMGLEQCRKKCADDEALAAGCVTSIRITHDTGFCPECIKRVRQLISNELRYIAPFYLPSKGGEMRASVRI